jgi:hypothetical protein
MFDARSAINNVPPCEQLWIGFYVPALQLRIVSAIHSVYVVHITVLRKEAGV